MQVKIKPTLHTPLPGLDRLVRSSDSISHSYRRLEFESLEQRIYLAGDVACAVNDDPVAYERAACFLANDNSNGPHLTAIRVRNWSFNAAENSYQVYLDVRAANVADGPYVIEARSAWTLNPGQFFDGESSLVSELGNTNLSVSLEHSTNGLAQLQVGIRRPGQPNSSPWLDLQTISVVLPIVDLSLTATTLDGSPLQRLEVGDDFVLHAWAQDLRPDPKGVFAAYMNIDWDSGVAAVSGELKHSDTYGNGKLADVSQPGDIRDAGGFGGVGQLKAGKYEVFSVRMRVISEGTLTFSATRALESPAQDILAHGINGGIDPRSVRYGKLSIPVAERPLSDKPSLGEQGKIAEPAPIAISAPQPPVLTVPPIAGVPIIVAVPDDAKGGQFVVSMAELFSPEFQTVIATRGLANKSTGISIDSRAVLLTTVNPGNPVEQEPLPMSNRETAVAIVSRKHGAEGSSDTSTDVANIAKTDLSLL